MSSDGVDALLLDAERRDLGVGGRIDAADLGRKRRPPQPSSVRRASPGATPTASDDRRWTTISRFARIADLERAACRRATTCSLSLRSLRTMPSTGARTVRQQLASLLRVTGCSGSISRASALTSSLWRSVERRLAPARRAASAVSTSVVAFSSARDRDGAAFGQLLARGRDRIARPIRSAAARRRAAPRASADRGPRRLDRRLQLAPGAHVEERRRRPGGSRRPRWCRDRPVADMDRQAARASGDRRRHAEDVADAGDAFLVDGHLHRPAVDGRDVDRDRLRASARRRSPPTTATTTRAPRCA